MVTTTDVIIPVGRNVNPPVFASNLYTKQISEDYPLGVSILQVLATDLDGDLIKYSIVNDTSGQAALGVFFLVPSSGVLMAIRPLAQTTGASFTVSIQHHFYCSSHSMIVET